MNLKEELNNLVDECFDDIFVEAHSIANTKSGDITPDQQLRLNKITEDFKKLLNEQVKQNL